MTINKIFCLTIFTLIISGCSTTPKKAIFESDAPPLRSILGVKGSKPTFAPKAIGRQESLEYNGYANPNENVFSELSNPTLLLYIEPHQTEKGNYVPGVVVPYKLYNKVEFALPGEL